MDEIEALGGPNASGANVPGAPATPLPHRMMRKVGVIGHRGGFFCCTPDNTMASVRYALSNKVPVIEIDTRLSADGVCVLVHDSTIDRTTDGTGVVSSMTVAQL
jgi:glycerophosphoryl diester phosphodiesterase